MTIRRISYAAYRRNVSFWISRQERGETIHLMQGRRVVGILHASTWLAAR